MTVLTRTAPAKLNLTLEITGKRPDGYHLLDSLVGFTAYGDTLAAEPDDGLRLILDGPFGATLQGDTAENLVLRAARLLAEAGGVPARARLRLTKNLPVASGIGGGSSDAAAALAVLAALWRLSPAPEDLQRLALTLGADVPVCLEARGARLEGIGERISPIPALPPAPIVLVNPGIGLATPKVFAERTGPFSPGPGPAGVLRDGVPADAAALAEALKPYGNDLMAPAIRLLPVIAEMLQALEAAPGCLLARMSGSGATCFALFATDDAAERAAATLSQANPAWWAVATRLEDHLRPA
jgi:4-diphosphocytidyl-2-C-methyl-D-erythritol kinase